MYPQQAHHHPQHRRWHQTQLSNRLPLPSLTQQHHHNTMMSIMEPLRTLFRSQTPNQPPMQMRIIMEWQPMQASVNNNQVVQSQPQRSRPLVVVRRNQQRREQPSRSVLTTNQTTVPNQSASSRVAPRPLRSFLPRTQPPLQPPQPQERPSVSARSPLNQSPSLNPSATIVQTFLPIRVIQRMPLALLRRYQTAIQLATETQPWSRFLTTDELQSIEMIVRSLTPLPSLVHRIQPSSPRRSPTQSITI